MKTNKKAKTTLVSKGKTLPTSVSPSHASKQLLVDVDNVSVALAGQEVIDTVSFCIHAGEFIGLIGQNGAGKTTLLKAVLGLLRPTMGKITKYSGAIGYIPQRGVRYDRQIPMSVFEVVKLGSYGNAANAKHALEAVTMAEYAHKRLTELSGGQQQRVLIAKALASNPALLILDEPTTGIDERAQADFYQLLGKLRAQGIAIIMVSHDIDVVLNQVTRVICLNRSILYDGPPEHFEAEEHFPIFYTAQHRLLHHQHGMGAKHA